MYCCFKVPGPFITSLTGITFRLGGNLPCCEDIVHPILPAWTVLKYGTRIFLIPPAAVKHFPDGALQNGEAFL